MIGQVFGVMGALDNAIRVDQEIGWNTIEVAALFGCESEALMCGLLNRDLRFGHLHGSGNFFLGAFHAVQCVQDRVWIGDDREWCVLATHVLPDALGW